MDDRDSSLATAPEGWQVRKLGEALPLVYISASGEAASHDPQGASQAAFIIKGGPRRKKRLEQTDLMTLKND